MSKADEALEIIRSLGLPRGQQNDRSALTLLALADLGPDDTWPRAKQPPIGIHAIAGFAREKYGKSYAENTRETIRRQTIHQFEQACIVQRNKDEPSRPTNSPRTVYSLSDDVLRVLRAYGTDSFDVEVAAFIARHGELPAAYDRSRKLRQVKLHVPSVGTVEFSPGKHNLLQVAVVEEFGPRFAPGSRLLYVGDAAKKHAFCDTDSLAKLEIRITEHDKLPDVVLYDGKKKWLFLIEAVTSHGPVNPKRHAEIEQMLSSCPAERVYVTAFLDRAAFRKYAADIAWETEVWIAESPDHMIHFNGPKFLGPYRVRQT
jgi:hypothetical protein